MTTSAQAGIIRVLGTLGGAVTVATAIPSLYLATLTILGSRQPCAALSSGRRSTTFAVLVPAHDEVNVIGDTVRALLGQDYPGSKFSVHVVADNCTDDTATMASDAGATVHVRHDPANKGKGAALNWLMDELAHTAHDAIVIVDADTIAERGMLAAFDHAFSRGSAVVQGYYGVKEPEVSPAVALRFAALACRHHLRPLGRNRLGASCGLYGNGMAFRSDVIEHRRWSDHLVEDAEFQIDLLLDGHVVRYVPDAVLLAEMPASSETASSQNERWELGRLQLARRSLGPLAGHALRGGELPRRVYLDATLDIITPPLSLLALLDTAALGLTVATSVATPSRRSKAALGVGFAASAALVTHVLVALHLVGAPKDVYRALGSAPREVLWKLKLLTRITRRPETVQWTRTVRNEPGRSTA